MEFETALWRGHDTQVHILTFDVSPMVRSAVIVIGDVERSPRMRYHARSLANLGEVYLVGYGHPQESHERIRAAPLTPYPAHASRRLPALLNYVAKTLWQGINLLLLLATAGRLDVVLCQNPPAIPTLAVCWLYCLFTGAKFIVDWHNYAHTIMALAHSKKSLIVRIARRIEFYFGRRAHAAFCVSQAMKNDLLENHDIQCKLLYDCPPDAFRCITERERHDILFKLSRDYEEFCDVAPHGKNVIERTVISEKLQDGTVALLPKRPGILFSSTSWTVDEDFSILLNALEDYDKAALADNTFPLLICVITGKGPMKDFYLKLIESKRLHRVKFVTPWLEAADYPLTVAAADLGVCLHTSSSGLDLPMKIVDMFGAGLPVCAYKYPCLRELVKEGENGFMFENSDQLAERIKTWFKNFPDDAEHADTARKFKNNLKSFQSLRWDANWENRAKPFFAQ